MASEAGGGVVLFAILTMLYEILSRRNYLAGVIIPVFSVFFVWFWGVYVSDMYWANAFRGVSASEDYSFLVKLKWWLVASLPLMPFVPFIIILSPIKVTISRPIVTTSGR